MRARKEANHLIGLFDAVYWKSRCISEFDKIIVRHFSREKECRMIESTLGVCGSPGDGDYSSTWTLAGKGLNRQSIGDIDEDRPAANLAVPQPFRYRVSNLEEVRLALNYPIEQGGHKNYNVGQADCS